MDGITQCVLEKDEEEKKTKEKAEGKCRNTAIVRGVIWQDEAVNGKQMRDLCHLEQERRELWQIDCPYYGVSTVKYIQYTYMWCKCDSMKWTHKIS